MTWHASAGGIATHAMGNLRPRMPGSRLTWRMPQGYAISGQLTNISSHRQIIARAASFHIGHSRAWVLAASPACLVRPGTSSLMENCTSLSWGCLGAVPAACTCARPSVHAVCTNRLRRCFTGISALACQPWPRARRGIGPARCGQGERGGDVRTDVVAPPPRSSTSTCSSTGMRQRPTRISGELGAPGCRPRPRCRAGGAGPGRAGGAGRAPSTPGCSPGAGSGVEIAGRNEALDEPGTGALRVPLQLGGHGGQESVVGHGLSHGLAAVPWAGSSPVSPRP